MNTNTTVERIQSVNTVPSTDSLPTGSWTAGELLARIDERSTIVTDLKHAPTHGPDTGGSGRWRGPAIALGIAAAILLVVGVVGILLNGGHDVAPAAPANDATPEGTSTSLTDPLDVVVEFDRLYDAADPAFLALFDPEVFSDVAWRNLQLSEARYDWVTGMTDVTDCVADGSRVTCTYTDTSGIDPSLRYGPYSYTYTVENGLITQIDGGGVNSAMTADRPALAAYRDWVRQNEPEKFDDLFLFGQTMATQTDELVRLQRAMIAQYQEATGKG